MHRHRFPWFWTIVVLSVTAVFAFGLSGFAEYFRGSGNPRTVADLFYLTGQLFPLNSGAVEGHVPWKLEVARFVAPLVAAYAIVVAALSLFSVEFRRWTVTLRGGHVIVCGLGRRGGRLVEELRNGGKKVVVIEPDEHNPGLPHCRDLGAAVIPGRSDDAWVLARAKLNRAAMLIATAGEDSVNIGTVVRAHALSNTRTRGRLRCIAHVTDPSLQQLLKSHQIFGNRNDPFDLELVNVYEAGARAMLEQANLAGWGTGDTIRSRRVAILGLGHFGEAVMRHILRDWTIRHAVSAGSEILRAGDFPTLEIVIIDREAAAKESSVRQRYRAFLGNVALHFVSRDARGPDFAGPDLAVSGPDQGMDIFFICYDDDPLATLAAIRIRDRFGPDVPIVVRMTEQAGFAGLLESDPAGCGTLSGIRAVGFMDIACMCDLFLGGDIEILGRAFHDAYLAESLAAGHSPATNPNIVPWHQLDKPGRDSSRRRAAEIRHQLDRAGFDIVPYPDRPAALLRFSEKHLEEIAAAEHARWLAEKRAAGWQFAPVRNDAQKRNPTLVPWDELEEPAKEFNRATVRHLPAILARADFEIRGRDSLSR